MREQLAQMSTTVEDSLRILGRKERRDAVRPCDTSSFAAVEYGAMTVGIT